MDSEDVNSISDSEEALQIVDIIETTYFDIIATREIPEHKELLKLTALSDSDFPTHFLYPTNTKEVEVLDYKDSDGFYRSVYWVEPLDFLARTDDLSSNVTLVSDKNGGTTLRIANNKQPTFYTSFDDEYIVMNSHDNVVESTLQQSKIRVYGTKYPTFDKTTDTFTPDLDETMFPYFIAEAKSVCMSLLKGGSDPKIEQAARRHKSFMQNDMYKTKRPNKWQSYGR
jgi:hypothetical protein